MAQRHARSPCRLVASGVLVTLVSAGTAHAANLADRLGGTAITRPLVNALSRAIVRSLPPTSTSASLARSWNADLQTFSIDRSLYGQLLLERPETIGRGSWSLIASYQSITLDSLDGRALDRFRDPGPPICGVGGCAGQQPLTIPKYHLDLATSEFSLAATYGITDDVEASIAMPVLLSNLGTRIVLRTAITRERLVNVASDDNATGVGDLTLKVKYRIVKQGPAIVALGLGLTLPTGDPDNLHGIGTVLVSPAVYASTDRLGSHRGFLLRPYLNVGADLDAENVAASEVRWGLGLDVRRGAVFTLAVGFLARHVLEAFGAPGDLDVARCANADLRACLEPDPQEIMTPLLGIGSGRRDLYDLTVGVRAALLRRRAILTLGVIIPVDDEGIRPAAIPLLGIELPFMKPPPAAVM